jgi:hypothetical protein
MHPDDLPFLEDFAVTMINDTSSDQKMPQAMLDLRSPTLDAIGILFDQKLEPVRRGMAELRQSQLDARREITSVGENVTILSKRVDDMVPRHDFTPNTRRLFVHVVWKRYGGSCPCCKNAKIVVDGREAKGVAHADHFNGRERNSPEDGWLVCMKCNQLLAHDGQFKERSKARFQVFQQDRLDLFGTRNRQSPRKSRRCSKMVQDHHQHSFAWP